MNTKAHAVRSSREMTENRAKGASFPGTPVLAAVEGWPERSQPIPAPAASTAAPIAIGGAILVMPTFLAQTHGEGACLRKGRVSTMRYLHMLCPTRTRTVVWPLSICAG